jgi:hypothetical protein
MTKDVIIELIHARACQTYTGPDPLAENAKHYALWIEHWRNTAKGIADEFRAEGLTASADNAERWSHD